MALSARGRGGTGSACARCGSLITQGSVQIDGRAFHAQCFRCDTCRLPIEGSYFPGRGGEPRCERCHEASAERCGGCARPILGRYLTVEARKYHPDCFACGQCRQAIQGQYFPDQAGFLCGGCHESRAPRCTGCRKPLLTKYTTVEGQPYHHECFRCKRCREPISAKYFGDKDGFLCAPCHEVENPPPPCTGCSRPVRGRVVTADGAPFHPECFCCESCRQRIEGAYLRGERGGFLCQLCQPRCDECGDPLAGQPSIRVGGQRHIHANCFRCCDCQRVLSNGHFEVAGDPTRSQCKDCHVHVLQRKEDLSEMKNIRVERRRTRQNSMDFTLFWRPELVPDSAEELLKMGIPRNMIPQGSHVVICHDAATGNVGFALSQTQGDGAAINVSYLGCVLKVLQEYRREPQFSLDPVDPKDISGAFQVKKFYPEWLAATVVGEVLFQADYALKEVGFGEKTVPGLPNFFDETWREEGGARASRQWFTISRAGMHISKDGVLMPRFAMAVESRRLTQDPTRGLVDAPFTDPNDPCVRQAQAITAQFREVAEHIPAIAQLVELARAMIVAVYLVERGCKPDRALLARLQQAEVPEGRAGYTMEIPTLRKERRSTSISSEHDGRLVTNTQARSMHGGVDLAIPAPKASSGFDASNPFAPPPRSAPKVPAKEAPVTVLPPQVRPQLLPLFIAASGRRPAAAA